MRRMVTALAITLALACVPAASAAKSCGGVEGREIKIYSIRISSGNCKVADELESWVDHIVLPRRHFAPFGHWRCTVFTSEYRRRIVCMNRGEWAEIVTANVLAG